MINNSLFCQSNSVYFYKNIREFWIICLPMTLFILSIDDYSFLIKYFEKGEINIMKPKKYKWLELLLTVILSLSILVGCSQQSGNDTQNQTNTTTEPSDDTQSGDATLESPETPGVKPVVKAPDGDYAEVIPYEY